MGFLIFIMSEIELEMTYKTCTFGLPKFQNFFGGVPPNPSPPPVRAIPPTIPTLKLHYVQIHGDYTAILWSLLFTTWFLLLQMLIKTLLHLSIVKTKNNNFSHTCSCV